MKDINGRDVTINAGEHAGRWGTRPFSITLTTRRGVRSYEATWHPTWNRARFATKREATAFIKAHEHAYYGRA